MSYNETSTTSLFQGRFWFLYRYEYGICLVSSICCIFVLMEPSTITKANNRIDLPFIDTDTKRNVESKECYIVLGNDFVEYKVLASYQSNDNEEGVWKDYNANYRWVRKKKDISNLEMFRNHQNTGIVYTVSLEFAGVGNPIDWAWLDPKEALAVYQQLREYMMS